MHIFTCIIFNIIFRHQSTTMNIIYFMSACRQYLTRTYLFYCGHCYRCPNGPPGTDPARTRFGPVRIGPGQARPIDASGRVGLAHVPKDMPKLGTHREKSCRAGPLARWASTDRAGHWPEPTVERHINTYI
jgi:hypothetical protein